MLLKRKTKGSKNGYHQELEADYHAEQLEVGGFVWFSENQQPRLGKILAVDATSPRPVTVQMFVPQANAASLSRVRFRAARHEEGGKPKVTRITIHQIQLYRLCNGEWHDLPTKT